MRGWPGPIKGQLAQLTDPPASYACMLWLPAPGAAGLPAVIVEECVLFAWSSREARRKARRRFRLAERGPGYRVRVKKVSQSRRT